MEPLKLEELKKLALEAPSQALAAHVVAYRVLGYNKDFAIFCMEQLATRRSNGEEFDYETYIDTNVKKMPKAPSVDLKQVKGMMNLKNISTLVKNVKRVSND